MLKNRSSIVICFILESGVVSTRQDHCHFAAIVHQMCMNLQRMEWLNSLLEARIRCQPLNLIGWNLWILLWHLDGASGLVQLYFVGDGSSAPLSRNSFKFHYFNYQFVGLDANFLGIWLIVNGSSSHIYCCIITFLPPSLHLYRQKFDNGIIWWLCLWLQLCKLQSSWL